MKYKNCKIKLVSEDKKDIENWIEKINKEIFFKNINVGEIYKCSFDMDNTTITDYRVNVQFESKASKNNIYWAMNQIKATPITFN